MRTGRRPAFFVLCALAALALIPANDAEFRWVNVVVAALAAFWAVMTAIEAFSRGRGERSAGL